MQRVQRDIGRRMARNGKRDFSFAFFIVQRRSFQKHAQTVPSISTHSLQVFDGLRQGIKRTFCVVDLTFRGPA
jgi:hypothetical protein